MVLDGVDITSFPRIVGNSDYSVWMPDQKGMFSVKSCKGLMRNNFEVQAQAKLIRRTVVHPSLSSQY